MKTAIEITGEGSGLWREEMFSVSDAIMNNKGPRGSDIALINTGHLDNIFHLIEVERTVQNK